MAIQQSTTGAVIPQHGSPPQSPVATTDQTLEDWNAYYQLLLSGGLKQYGGEFIVIHRGKVVGQGADPELLRSDLAKQLGIAAEKLVIPFVDHQECIASE